MSVAEPATAPFPAHPKLATVLFDEAHSEAWTIRAELATRMQPSHPGDSSLALAAAALAERDFEVAAHASGELDEHALANVSVLVIAHPSSPEWEATTGSGTPIFSAAELDAIESFVRAGGGLVCLGETEQAKYGSNLNDLLSRFGIALTNDTIQDYEHHHHAPSWVLAELPAQAPVAGSDLLARVEGACFYRAGSLELADGARPIARAHRSASNPGAPLLAVTEHGAGRVVACADSDLFGDDCIDELGHRELWRNLVYWAARRAFAEPESPAPSAAADDPAWHALKAAVSELRELQSPDGSVDTERHDGAHAAELAERIKTATAALAGHFPHQSGYLDALALDLDAWVAGGFAKPDFTRSIEAFRPERHREDGTQHLVVFPMYKQNASPDTCFEALIVSVPWPDWVRRIEAERYDNAKFLPVTFVDRTAGYDSECAVLFPETFSAPGRPEAHFGAIFCDREAERFRRVCGRAAELLELNLPPDAAALLASPELSRDAYILWDLVHDRTHMRGDLPFDPFMIRQRSPYWMYALEELRCDLTAFAEAVRMEREGFAFARYAQYAIVFDRLFRFPVTGSRTRNYDGLGGQLLFAYLHLGGYLHWTDNRLTIDWDRLTEGVEGLRAEVQGLYHSGIDRSKLGQWLAAHDLVSAHVPAAEDSVWARERRELPSVEEPKQLVDLVRDDEFPLSLFYAGLGPKLADVLTPSAVAA